MMKSTKKAGFSVLLFALAFACFVPFQSQAQRIDSTQLLSDIRILSSIEFAGRRPGTPEHQKSVDYITDRFKKLDLEKYNNSYVSEFPINEDGLIGKNIIGYISGQTDKAIVITGHYDHIGVRRGELHPGADDNASGAAGLMAIAEYFAQNKPMHTLIFVSFDAEEMGLRGARYFVDHPPVPIENIVLNINMDMISRNDQNRLVAAGTHHSPHLIPAIDRANNPFIQLIKGYDVPGTGRDDWTMQSDQGAFHRKGIPFIYFGVEDHPDYHTPRDTFENIQPQYFYQATRLILDVIIDLDATLPL